MNSPVGSPVLRPTMFQNHIYNAFLNGKTTDVALRIRASWNAIYRFHRLILIQAEYFDSLFTGGFVESEDRDSSFRPRVSGPIDIELGDTNITRAAFELCIARLYGGGPSLFVDPAMILTPSHPLAPSFPSRPPPRLAPPGHQPATPRFLLSLLAASIYLSIPSVTAEALSSVTCTIGPFTVMDYLRFAYGEGIGPPQEVDLDPLVGLEHVAQLVKAAPAKCDPPSIGAKTRTRDKDVEYFSQNLEALSVEDPIHSSQGGATHGMDLSVEKEDPAEVSSDSCSPTTPNPDETESEPSYSYGAVSDKIGEACVCWLAKWGADLLVYEQRAAGLLEQSASVAPVATPPRAISRRSTVSSWRTPNSDTIHSSPPQPPLIWRRGGLTAAWVRALISSDMLFIEGEKERYNLAKDVVELRRNEGILEEEEVEWGKLFTEGIYYANLSFDDLVYVAHDRSPTTGCPYVPERVLQAAYWTQSMLRHKIVGPQSSSPSSSPASISRHKELGISRSQKDIKEVLFHPDKDEENCAYWPIPSPSSMRIGEYADAENLAMDELFGLSSTARRHVPGRSLMSASNFFGLKNDRCTATECVLDGSSNATRWIPYPPYRFGVEFWDVNSLREKSHLYSQTIWYAGSLFNVFVQVFRKKAKEPQLGVYLHRQSSIDPIPPLSVPFESIPADNPADSPASPPALSSPPSLTILSPNPTEYSDSGLPVVDTPRATTPVQGLPLNSSTSGSSLPATSQPVVPSQPYRDPRAQLSAYFTISCSSAAGTSATRFASNPDDFSISQSWGWRSSSLWAEVCLKDKDEKIAGPSTPSLSGDMRSMRITVVLGVV